MIAINIFQRIKDTALDYLDILTFFIYTMRSLFIQRGKGKKLIIESILKQVLFTGLKALFVMSIVSLLIGGVIIFIINKYGFPESVISLVLILTIIQYVGPLITLMVLIGRSGTAIAAEIGNMKMSHEIEALEIMGIDSLHYVAAPRIIGMSISIVCLSIFFSMVGIMGGAVMMVNLVDNFSLDKFYRSFFNNLTVLVIIESILKILISGMIISTVGCYQGFQVKHSSTEVPQMTTLAVGRSIILCFIFYVYITVIFVI